MQSLSTDRYKSE